MSAPDPHRFVIVPHRPHLRGWLIVAAVLWLLSLIAVGWWARHTAAPALAQSRQDAGELQRMNQDQGALIKELRQRVATLKRSDEISRSANLELQSTLADHEEEISGLRADVDFYERLVGATGQRHGLSVHEAVFAPEPAGTWHYTVTLTQNLNRGAISKGELRLSIEGVRAGRLATLRWDDLLQKANAPGQPFSFRYFQQVEGSVMLPPGFKPQRVRVQLRAANNTVEQPFGWILDKNTQGD